MKYCKEHKQEYMDFLHECPICGGERYGRENPPKRILSPNQEGYKPVSKSKVIEKHDIYYPAKAKVKLEVSKPTQVKLF